MDEAQPSPRTVRFELSGRTLLAVCVVVASVWLLGRMLPVLLVVIAALMMVGALNPVVEWLERHGVRRFGAIALVFAVGVTLVSLGLFLTIPPLVAQARDVIEHEPEIRAHVVAFLEGSPFTQALADELRTVQYTELLKESRATLLTASLRAVEGIAYGFAAVFLALYIMIDRDRLRGALFALVPRRHHVRTSRILLNLETIVGGYIRGQVITCIASAIFIFVLLFAFRVPNALAIAVFGGAMDLLPYIGAFLAMLPAVVAGYTVEPWIAVMVFAGMLLYEEFESRILVPWVYGRALRLPSSAVFAALLAGGVLGGIIGALLALPIASTLLMLLHELRVELPGEAMRPQDVALREEDEREVREYEQRAEATPAVEAAAIAVEIARERQVVEEATKPDEKSE